MPRRFESGAGNWNANDDSRAGKSGGAVAMGVSMLTPGGARGGAWFGMGQRDRGVALADFTAGERLLLDAARRAISPGWIALIL